MLRDANIEPYETVVAFLCEHDKSVAIFSGKINFYIGLSIVEFYDSKLTTLQPWLELWGNSVPIGNTYQQRFFCSRPIYIYLNLIRVQKPFSRIYFCA